MPKFQVYDDQNVVIFDFSHANLCVSELIYNLIWNGPFGSDFDKLECNIFSYSIKKNGYNNVYMFQLLATKVQDKVQTCSDNLGICNNIWLSYTEWLNLSLTNIHFLPCILMILVKMVCRFYWFWFHVILASKLKVYYYQCECISKNKSL